jgi:hypothetical protein
LLIADGSECSALAQLFNPTISNQKSAISGSLRPFSARSSPSEKLLSSQLNRNMCMVARITDDPASRRSCSEAVASV